MLSYRLQLCTKLHGVHVCKHTCMYVCSVVARGTVEVEVEVEVECGGTGTVVMYTT